MEESFCTLLGECPSSESALARYSPLHHRRFRLRGLDTKMLREHIGSSSSPHTVQRPSWSEKLLPLCPSRDKVLTFPSTTHSTWWPPCSTINAATMSTA